MKKRSQIAGFRGQIAASNERFARRNSVLHNKLTLELARELLEAVVRDSVDDPHALYELAAVRARNGDFGAAIELLTKVLNTPWGLSWHWREWRWKEHRELKLIALTELNGVVAAAKRRGWTRFPDLEEFIAPVPLDLRVVLSSGDGSRHMRLRVIEPSGETATASHHSTTIGGRLTSAAHGSHVVAEYTLPKAGPGTYKVVLQYQALDATDDDDDDDDDWSEEGNGGSADGLGAEPIEPDEVWLRVSTRFGTADEKSRTVRRRLADDRGTVELAEIEF